MVRGWTGCLSCRSCAEAMRGRAGALRTAEMGLAETNGGSGLRALKEGSGGVCGGSRTRRGLGEKFRADALMEPLGPRMTCTERECG